eukprot:3496457-Rhodomonas_salina.1
MSRIGPFTSRYLVSEAKMSWFKAQLEPDLVVARTFSFSFGGGIRLVVGTVTNISRLFSRFCRTV